MPAPIVALFEVVAVGDDDAKGAGAPARERQQLLAAPGDGPAVQQACQDVVLGAPGEDAGALLHLLLQLFVQHPELFLRLQKLVVGADGNVPLFS